MKFIGSEVEAHPIMAAPPAVRRAEIVRAFVTTVVVFAALWLLTASVLIDGFGGRIFFH